MAKPYKLLRDKLPASRRLEAEHQAAKILAEMALDELRQAREKTQQELAAILEINQAAVSKLENRIDMYVSTLRKYVEALGGDLEILACFPDGTVRITQFEEIEQKERKISRAAAASS